LSKDPVQGKKKGAKKGMLLGSHWKLECKT